MEKNEIFVDIIDQYTSILYQQVNYLINNNEDAEDIVQETILSAYQAYDNFQGQSNIKTWLTRILKNKVADYYRKKYRQNTHVSLDNFFIKDGSWQEHQKTKEWTNTDESLLEDIEFKKIFENCIEKLPPKWSIPIKLYYLEEKKTDFLSQELGITTTNIWKILQRGRLQLKDCLEKNWFNL